MTRGLARTPAFARAAAWFRRQAHAMCLLACVLAAWANVAHPKARDARIRTVADSLAADSLAASDNALPGRVVAESWTLDAAGRGPRLMQPAGLAVDAFGRFAVSDAAAHRVLRYDRDGAWLDEVGALGSDPGQLRRPTALATLGSLGIAVLDRENHRVVSYDLMGRRIGTLVDLDAEPLTTVTGRIDAVALAADRGGALYVADAERDRVLVFDFLGRYLREFGGYGTRSGAFRGLAGLASAPRGELLACERGGRRVQQLDAGGRVVRAWPVDVAPGRASVAVAVDDSGRVAVADVVTGRLLVFDRSGRPWASRRDLRGPTALAFTPEGELLVAESTAARVRRFILVAADPGRRSGGN